MEMAITQVASSQSQTQVATNGQASKSAGGADFQKALVQQINGEPAANNSETQGTQLVAVIPKEAAAQGDTSTLAPTLSDLMSIIDGLLEQLQTSADEEGNVAIEDEQQIKQLEAVLDQMNALLALLGLPVPVIQPTISHLSNEVEESSDAKNVINAVTIKSSLQDTLLQMQVMLQQGSTKRIGQQEPTALIAQQLQALTAILEGVPMDTTKVETKSNASSQQLFTAQDSSQSDVSTLLQRLSQQTVHSASLTTAIQSMEQVVDTQTTASTVDMSPQIQPGANNPETMRTLSSLVANTAATTSFVVADEFAKSMTGMIVQKFDLTTLNGVSEAKIMLFPEQLGQVDVRITMQNGLLTAIFQTDTVMAKEMLDNQMAQLRAALQAQGLNVDKLEVSHGQSTAQLFQQQQGQGSHQQQSSNRQSGISDDHISGNQFETEMIEQAAIKGLGFGRGINVSV